MFYPLSKFLTALTYPSSLVAVLIGLGLLLQAREQRRPLGRKLTIIGFAAYLILGISPLGNALVLPLEQRAASYPQPKPNDRYAGIIILGGFEDGWVSAGRPGLAVNESAERLTEAIRLARRYPDAKIVFTGGSGAILLPGADAAGPVGRYLADVGIAPDRIVLEDKSRNTHENAVFTREVVKPKPGERWLLVTSAYHMPRSVGIFRKAGFDIAPYPVDFRTRGWGDAARVFESMPDGMKRVDMVSREYVGLLVYWLTGRTDSIWPEVAAK